MYTQKTDWMNDYLANSNYYVSDHLSYSSKLELPTDAKVSLRFFGNIKLGYVFLLAINAPRELWNSCLTPRVKEHLNNLNMITGSKIPLLLFSDDNPEQYGVVENRSKGQLLDSNGLRHFFGQFNQKFLSDVGDAKPKNKTYNDSFQAWTIHNLSKYLTVNDIDAFGLSSAGNRLNIIELKRPNESCETWLPYVDDTGNYKAGNWMSANLRHTHFKTIAYNATRVEPIVFLEITHIQQRQLSGNLYRGKVQAIDLESLVCLNPLVPFVSNRVRKQHYR